MLLYPEWFENRKRQIKRQRCMAIRSVTVSYSKDDRSVCSAYSLCSTV
jgi:hypothetical protein